MFEGVCACAVIGFDLLSVYFPHSADHMNRFIVYTESPLCCSNKIALSIALSLLDSLSSGDDEDYDEDEDDAGNGNGVFHPLISYFIPLF